MTQFSLLMYVVRMLRSSRVSHTSKEVHSSSESCQQVNSMEKPGQWSYGIVQLEYMALLIYELGLVLHALLKG